MKYRNGLAFSTIALAILTTGCVKKAENGGQVVYDNSQSQGAYGNTTYDTTDTTTYDTTVETGTTYNPNVTYDTTNTTTYDPNTVTYDNTVATTSGSIYTGEATDNTQVTTTDVYGQPVASNNGAYNNPYGTTDNYPDPYASGSQSSNNNTYSAPVSSSTSGRGGINLQIAALADYYAAEEFKNSLSLDPKYSAYVKRGNPNKVIITGISSTSEANRLKESRFPGAFVVSGGSSYSSSSYGSNSGYTTNNSYGSSTASNGFGVQIGAFSSHSKAQDAAESAGSQYSPFVKTVNSNGRTLYKAILTGFSSESAARSFIANRGSGFLVHGL